MVDPLSLTASIIAVLGISNSVGKALSKIKLINESPDELLALINEVSDIRVVLYDIDCHFRKLPPICPTETASVELHSHLSDLVNRAKGPFFQLEQMVEY